MDSAQKPWKSRDSSKLIFENERIAEIITLTSKCRICDIYLSVT